MDVANASIKALEEYVEGLSNPSKMPGFGYSLPAADCQVGTRLRDVDGSTCQHCYAFERGRYGIPKVTSALKRRLAAITKEHWVPAMTELINRRASKCDVFRWHDSGDLQSVEHFRRICAVAEGSPDVRHWLPTREYRYVSEFVTAGGIIPKNLNVRLSAHMIGGNVPTFPRLKGLVTISTVSDGETFTDAHQCPAPQQGNHCGGCRACWDKNVPHVDYHLH